MYFLIRAGGGGGGVNVTQELFIHVTLTENVPLVLIRTSFTYVHHFCPSLKVMPGAQDGLLVMLSVFGRVI